MPAKHEVGKADRLFCDLMDLPPGDTRVPSFDAFLVALRQFAEYDFDVDESNDGDGFLFEYGVFRSIPPLAFVIGFARQFDLVGADGEHEAYVQLQLEYRYSVDQDLESIGRKNDWWFKPGGDRPFGEWLDSILNDPVWPLLSDRTADSFVVQLEEL